MFDLATGGPPMRPTPPASVVALFDGQCGVCSRSAKWIGTRDPDHRVERLDLRDPHAAARFPGLSPDAVRAQMHVVTVDGVVIVGLDAVRAAFALLPRWGFVASVLGMPGLHALAGVGYALFARNRLVFNRWFPLPEGEQPCTDACAVDWAALERAAAEAQEGSR